MNESSSSMTPEVSLAPPKIKVELPELDLQTMQIRLHDTSPLIVHKWSEKAKQQMLDKQTKRASTGKGAKDPEQDYLDSLYRDDEGNYVFPAIAFKSAAVRAGTYADMKMTFLRGAFHVIGEWVRIDGEPRPRQDMVRVGMGTADIRYRGEFPEWGTLLRVAHNARAISPGEILNLFRIAGFSVGVGEWRPERDGSYGRFEVL